MIILEQESMTAFELKTHVSFYDDLLESESLQEYRNISANIIYITPREYFNKCADIFNSTVAKQIEQVKNDTKVINMLVNLVNNGTKLYLPYLRYTVTNNEQEGRHRMYVVGNIFGWDVKQPCGFFTTIDTEKELTIIKNKEQSDIADKIERELNKLSRGVFNSFDEILDEIRWVINDMELNSDVNARIDNNVIVVSYDEQDIIEYPLDEFEITEDNYIIKDINIDDEYEDMINNMTPEEIDDMLKNNGIWESRFRFIDNNK